jgi:hypothetical protein
MDRDLDPFSLSRKLAHGNERQAVWREALTQGPSLSDPFQGEPFPGKSTYEWAEKLPPGDPLRASLLRWIHRLTDLRVHVPWLRQDADLERRSLHLLREPEEVQLTLAEIRARALRESGEIAGSYFRGLASAEGALSFHRALLWTRRVEVALRLGLSPSEVLPLPIAPEESPSLEALARRLLRDTMDAAQETQSGGWAGLVEAGLAGQATEGWPARLAADSLRTLFGARELFHSVDLRVPRLPARLCPMSFPRAGALIGRALSKALAPTDVPFVVARDPDDLLGHEVAHVFLWWSTSQPFQQRVLGLSPSAAQEQSRHLRVALLAHVRLAAARLLLAQAALRGQQALAEAYPEVTTSLLGEPLPETSALVRFQVRWDEGARFAALLGSLADVASFIDRYDEDWFRNPRFQEELRARLMLPAGRTCSADRCGAGLEQIMQRLAR